MYEADLTIVHDYLPPKTMRFNFEVFNALVYGLTAITLLTIPAFLLPNSLKKDKVYKNPYFCIEKCKKPPFQYVVQSVSICCPICFNMLSHLFQYAVPSVSICCPIIWKEDFMFQFLRGRVNISTPPSFRGRVNISTPPLILD